MNIDLSDKPYRSRFDVDNQYTMALFQPNRETQASELTEVQEMIRHSMSNLGDSLFDEGDIQSGMGYRISDGSITVDTGYVYIGGKIRKFNEQTIEFNPEGEFNVQVRLEQTIVTSKEDNRLLDHSLGDPSQLAEGADRLKETVVLVANDPVGEEIYTFLDGELTNQLQKPEMSKITEVLAERTFDESGSYVVDGLDLSVEDSGKPNTVYVVVKPGRAYVRGHQITKAIPLKLEIPKALGTQDVEGEVFYYDNVSRQGFLGNASVKSVNRVLAPVHVSRERLNRGAVSGTKDSLKNNPVIDVLAIWEEDVNNNITKEYVKGEDYNLTDGKDIDWSPSGGEPSGGTSYFVSYIYNEIMRENVDYKLVTRLTGNEVTTALDFNDMGGKYPVDKSKVLVDYTYYLAREDLVIMDHNGEVSIKQGEYSAFNKTIPPLHNDPQTLILGSIKLYPNSSIGSVASTSVKTVNMSEIRKLISRVKNIEFNEAMNALDEDSILGADPSALRGIFSDSFIDSSRGDIGHPDFTASYMPSQLSVTTAAISLSTPHLKFNEGKSTAVINNKTISAPYSEVESIRQPIATNTMNINPYKVFDTPAVLTLDPSSDSWVEERKEVVDGKSYNIGSVLPNDILALREFVRNAPSGKPVNSKGVRIAEALGLEVYDDGTTNFTGGSGGSSRIDHVVVVGTSDKINWATGDYNLIANKPWTSQSYRGLLVERAAGIAESSIEYMRPIEVSFKGENFRPGTDNIELIFDSKLVPITPATGYDRGTLNGTIKANSEGVVEGTFTVPDVVETGVKEVVLQSRNNIAHSSFESTGVIKTAKIFQESYNFSSGRIHNKGLISLINQQVSKYKADPLAQTFQFLSDRTLSSVNLYFESKDITEGVLVQVRDVPHSGMPGDLIYSEEFVSPEDIKVSSDGSIPTKVTFKDPVQCEGGKQYAIVLMSNSDEYEMFIGTVGEDDLLTGESVITNPYGAGMLLSSANTSAWTTHQSSDLKFVLSTSEYAEESIAYFGVIEDVDANNMILLADYINPHNTDVIFEYRMVGKSEADNVLLENKEWEQINPVSSIDLRDNIRFLEVRAILKSMYNISPLINKDNLMLVFQSYGTEGTYVSRTVNSEDAPFNTVRVRLDVYNHPATSTVVKYSTDAGDTWKNFTVEPEAKNVGDGFYELFWEEKISEGNQTHDSIKYRIDMETSTNFVQPMASMLRTSTTDE